MIDAEQLIACALGELAGEAEATVEEHVLSCDECADRYATFVRLARELPELIRGGHLAMPITPALYARMQGAGLVSRYYVLAPGSTVPCGVSAADIYSVIRLECDLRDVARVDLVRGGERIPDVVFDDHAVLLATPSELVRRIPTMKLPFQLVSVDEHGERTLASYTLDHTGFAG